MTRDLNGDPRRSNRRYVYGPVPSRRLGRSLGVDLVPFKTCSYDCIYCQLGRTTQKTVERRAYVPGDALLREIREALARGPRPDVITLAGSGEPTLHSGLRSILTELKKTSEIPVAVLTNGSLLWQEEVAEACRGADLVLPSLDAGDPALFESVNRPHRAITYPMMLQGLIDFRRRYRGKLWMEVMLLGGITGIPSEARKIARHLDRIRPDRIQVNTAVRPPAEDFAFRIPRERLLPLCRYFGEKAEVIADFRGKEQEAEEAQAEKVARDDVLALLSRRPCSLEDLVRGLHSHPNEVLKYVTRLVEEGLISGSNRGGIYFYRLRGPESPPE